MKKHFIVYASKNRPSAKISIQASHLSDKYEEPAYGFKDLPHELDAQSDAFANTSLDILHKLWVSMSDADQYAAEYAIAYLDSNYGGLENVPDDDYLLDAARYGCNIAAEGNAEPEYIEEDFYMDEPDFDKVYNYLKAKLDDKRSITGSCNIEASEGYRDDNDWLLKPGNTWYAVEVFSEDGGASAAGPTVQSDYLVYQAKTPEDALALAQKDHYPHAGVGEVRLATPDEIEEMYYYMSKGTCPDCDYDNWSFGGLIDDEEVIE